MKKIKLISLLFACSFSSLVFANATTDVDTKAIPSDTASTSFLLCNFTDRSVGWWFTSVGEPKVVVGSGWVQTFALSGSLYDCGIVTLRGSGLNLNTINVPLSDGTRFLLENFSYSYNLEVNRVVSFKASRVDGDFYIYSGNDKTKAESFTVGKVYNNLDNGLEPDFVICKGGTADKCKYASNFRN